MCASYLDASENPANHVNLMSVRRELTHNLSVFLANCWYAQKPATLSSPRTVSFVMHRSSALTYMQEFVVGQKWRMTDAVFGTFIGEVIEVSENGAAGTVMIMDDQGNEVDTFTGTAAEFQASGEWRLEK